ncbi:MAG: M1 family aminopeptidase [Flavobacterium sp.]|uniref:M1 family aminopeptidase n=1 Tax=Flavobacterium sp. TaxID=239 RepID=UPI003527ED5A
MKNIYLFFFCISVSFVFSQKKESTTKTIAEAEMNSASRIANFQANPNTANYDVTYQKLEFTVNPAVKFVSGKITTTFTALTNMNSITFDFANELTASVIKKGATNLSFTENSNNELVITLPSTQLAGTSATIEVTYSGVPPNNGFDSFVKSTHNGTPIIWTLSEPFGARDWWPCKQDLNDKVDSIDVYITAPSQYIGVSNGIEPEAPVINGANKTTHFHHGYPIPAYLIAIAVTNYTVYNQVGGTAPNEYPIINYIYPENFASIQPQLSETPAILELYENLFEIYPFHNEKYGHAQFGWGGGMEHTTVSFMVGFDRQLIAHEMGHQWFGDKITCGSWKDIWLNEGFATYLAALVIENFDGLDSFIAEKIDMVDYITSSPNGNVYLDDIEATNVNRIFSSRLSYNKGAMILEMLRFKMGDTAFFQALRNYLADPNLAYKYAVTTDLKSHLEAVYGQDLTEFFDDWVYNEGYPTYDITAQNWGSGQAKFVVSQTQSDASVSYFEMPVPVRVYGSNGEEQDIVLENTFDNQEFVVNIPFTITNVVFDPEQHLIARNSTATLQNSNVEWNQTISVFPNPTNSILHIQKPNDLSIESVTLYNSLGQIVFKSNENDLTIESLSNGVYELQLNTNQGKFHKRIIKQ